MRQCWIGHTGIASLAGKQRKAIMMFIVMAGAYVWAEADIADDARVESAVREFAAMVADTARRADALRVLEGLPSERVLTALLRVMRESSGFQQPDVRRYAYDTLFVFHAEKTAEGRQQLVRCLYEEPDTIRGSCVQLINQIRIADLGEDFITAIDDVWSGMNMNRVKGVYDDNNDESSRVRKFYQALLTVTARLESRGVKYADKVRAMAESDEVDLRIRTDAAYALLRTVGIEQTFADLKSSAPGESALLWASALYLAKAQAAHGLDELTAKMIRERFLAALAHADAGTRVMALRQLEVVFGDQFLTIRSRTDYDVNSQIKTILHDLARKDSDEEVRGRAAKLLDADYIDSLASRIFRATESVQQRDKPNE